MALSKLYSDDVAKRVRIAHTSASTSNTLLIFVVVVTALYLGRAVFVPFAVAVIFAFILAPVIKLLRRWYIPKVLAVATSVMLTAAILFSTVFFIANQIRYLAEDIPYYETTLTQKIKSLQQVGSQSEFLSRISNSLTQFRKGITGDKESKDKPQTGQGGSPDSAIPPPATAKNTKAPLAVVIQQPQPSIFVTLQSVANTLLPPLASLGIIFLFLTFILLQREDLRDRAIRLFGSGDLERTTTAMNDGASRLSRFFLIQTILNLIFGLVIGIGLWVIGTPAPLLWGILAFLMRYVPFVGSFIAAAPPVFLAAAIDPGWSAIWWTVALFLVAEPVMGNLIEPLVQSQTTGMSPLAIIISAAFWTLLWGPIGLLLAVPLTVCLVVLGRHVDRLEFLDIILGDRPALSPVESFYQRALAGDADEASDQAEGQLKECSLLTYYDTVLRPGLILAQRDVESGFLDKKRQEQINHTVSRLIENLEGYEDITPEEKTSNGAIQKWKASNKSDTRKSEDGDLEQEHTDDIAILTEETRSGGWNQEHAVLCVAATSKVDTASAEVLQHLLHAHGIGAKLIADTESEIARLRSLDKKETKHICVITLTSDTTAAKIRFLIKRLRRTFPSKSISVVLLAASENIAAFNEYKKTLSVEHILTRYEGTVAFLVAAATRQTEEIDMPAGKVGQTP